MAMMTVLETLGATERAILVLGEVFEMPYDHRRSATRWTYGNSQVNRDERMSIRR